MDAAVLPTGLASPIPCAVAPYYQAEGPTITIGPLSQALGLATPDTIDMLAEAWRPALAYQPATTLFVLAVRLFDLGQHEAGLYWFYQAQYRARLLYHLLDHAHVHHATDPAFELTSAHIAFLDQCGPSFTGYAGCSLARWLGTLERVRQENQAVPDLTLIYPGLAFHPPAEWPSRNQELNDGLRDLADRLRAGWDELQAQRRADGTHERFCGAANKGA